MPDLIAPNFEDYDHGERAHLTLNAINTMLGVEYWSDDPESYRDIVKAVAHMHSILESVREVLRYCPSNTHLSPIEIPSEVLMFLSAKVSQLERLQRANKERHDAMIYD